MSSLPESTTLSQRVAGTMRRLRHDSDWINLKILGIVSAVLGLLSDTLKSVFPLLAWFFPTVVVVTLLSFVVWLGLRKSHQGPAKSQGCLLFARATLGGLIASAVLVPILLLSIVSPDERGAVVQLSRVIVSAQDYLGERFNKIDSSLANLETEARRSNEKLVVLTDEAKLTNKQLEPVREGMELSTALSLLARAKENSSGTDQGQVAAVVALVARKYSLAAESLHGVSLAGGVYDAPDFANAGMHFTSLSGATFKAAKFEAADLRFANADHAIFSQKTSLFRIFAPFLSAKEADFSGAGNMREANFFGADLRAANFSGVDLTGAVFSFADLSGANFENATLANADFTGSILTASKFASAVLTNTGMFGAVRDSSTLDGQQIGLICRPPLDNGHVTVYVHLIERWPSTRFASGYEFDSGLFESRYYLGPGADTALPQCLIPASNEHVSPGFYPKYPGEFELKVDRVYLDKADRRRGLKQIMKDFVGRFNQYKGA